MTAPADCPSRIAQACTCTRWCHDATALDRLDPVAASPWQWPDADLRDYPTQETP